MKRHAFAALSLTVLFLTVPIAAQYRSVGSLFESSAFIVVTTAPVTFLDLTSPATADGAVNQATVRWQENSGAAPCAGSFLIRFVRPVSNFGGTAHFFTPVATRGPFESKNGTFTVALSPPVDLKAGDLVGVVQLRDSSACGGVALTSGSPRLSSAYLKSNADTFDLREAQLRRGQTPGVRASNNGLVLEGVIAGAGSAQGSGGSFFRTSLQLMNPDRTVTVQGSIIFHPAGKAASPADPRLKYELGPGKSVFYEDVVAAMGQSGLGSIDILTQSSPSPAVTARVFNDQGTSGTYGFNEDFIRPIDALSVFDIGHVTVPDPAKYRTNIGVRSLQEATTVVFELWSADGVLARTFQRTYAKDFFEQTSLAALIAPAAPVAGRLTVRISAGSAIVYASSTDNRTNDSNVEIARAP